MTGSQKRIAIAVIFAAGLVSTALFLRSDRQTPATAPVETVAVVRNAPERSAIIEEDSNNDGVPDWQEALQKTEAIQVTGEATGSYTPPETLTEQFALDFFEDMVRAENYGDFGDSPEELVAGASTELTNQAYDTLLTQNDITTSDNNTQAALNRYGETVARVMQSAPATAEENEAVILERALRNQDASELKKLDEKIAAYEYMLDETKAITVPSRLTQEHLNLLNAYQALISDIEAMSTAFDDPMLALLRMKRYQDDASGLYATIVNLYGKLLELGAVWEQDSPVYNIVNIPE